MPRVCIVILNWNGSAQMKRFLPGVLDAVPPFARVVVADNGSSDDSVEWLRREVPSVELILLDANYGYAGGYNRALKSLDAEYFVLLNSDVETPRGWLDPLLETLESHPECAAVAPKVLAMTDRTHFEYAGASGGFIDFLGYPFCRGRMLQCIERDCGQYDDEREVFWASGAAFCCRAEVFDRLGGFDADFFAHMEEIDLCWRMQLAGYTVRVNPASVVYHLGGGTLAAGSPFKVYLNHRNNLMMLCKCASAGQRVVVALVRPLLDAAAAFSYLAQGRWDCFRAVGRAWLEFLRAHPSLRRKRKEITAGGRNKVHGIYCGSVVLRYLFGLRRFNKMM